jgi:hypothetical protein
MEKLVGTWELDFLYAGIGDDGTRAFMNVLHIETVVNTPTAVTTNGRVLHSIKNFATFSLPSGDYKMEKVKKDYIITLVPDNNYPNWKRVLPEDSTRRGTFTFSPTEARAPSCFLSRSITDFLELLRTPEGPVYVDFSFIEPFRKLGLEWKVSQDGRERPIVLENGTIYGIIMPQVTR